MEEKKDDLAANETHLTLHQKDTKENQQHFGGIWCTAGDSS